MYNPPNPPTPHQWPHTTSRWCCLLWYHHVLFSFNFFFPPLNPSINSDISLSVQCGDLKVIAPTFLLSVNLRDSVLLYNHRRWSRWIDEAILDNCDTHDYKLWATRFSLWSLWLSTGALSVVIESDLHGQIPLMSSTAPRGDHPQWEQGGGS